MKNIDCTKCRRQEVCCHTGAWVDLEEAKKIVALGLNRMFYHLEEDRDYPSGYRIGTSFEDNRCSFLDPDGLCSIHKIDYDLKPAFCKEFPYENGRLAEFADILCPQAKPKKRIKKRPSKAVK
ncbi:MAG: YkgJ family cysteine cluster protein [Candidatus Omnitrophica bacterium]|nr:YkgJ family cysteine cluster protein [Candidatus Omnitrophota bacterium]